MGRSYARPEPNCERRGTGEPRPRREHVGEAVRPGPVILPPRQAARTSDDGPKMPKRHADSPMLMIEHLAAIWRPRAEHSRIAADVSASSTPSAPNPRPRLWTRTNAAASGTRSSASFTNPTCLEISRLRHPVLYAHSLRRAGCPPRPVVIGLPLPLAGPTSALPPPIDDRVRHVVALPAGRPPGGSARLPHLVPASGAAGRAVSSPERRPFQQGPVPPVLVGDRARSDQVVASATTGPRRTSVIPTRRLVPRLGLDVGVTQPVPHVRRLAHHPALRDLTPNIALDHPPGRTAGPPLERRRGCPS